MSIVVEQLTKYYHQDCAVQSLQFGLKKGEIVGFLGPNGAGKTTTLKMLTGNLMPTRGNIWIDSIDLKINPISAKQKLGYLAEHNPLYEEMYVKQYLSFIYKIFFQKSSPDAIETIIQKTGLTKEKNKKIFQLSKGYRQRVGLAAALVHNPSVLILDEPTTGLDPNQIIEIRQLLYKEAENKTILFSSHLIPEIMAICTRILIIHEGQLKADMQMEKIKKENLSLEKIFVQLTRSNSETLVPNSFTIF